MSSGSADGTADALARIARFYDRWSPVFLETAGTTLQAGLVAPSAGVPVAPEASARYLAHLAGVAPGDHVLDAGCGVGGPAVAIAQAIPGVVVDGVTLSAVQARTARALAAEAGLAGRVRVCVADFHRLPFPDASFDVALLFEVTGYSPDLPALYRECARILRPGGTVYVKDVFCREEPLTGEERAAIAASDRLWAAVRSPTLSETADALRAAGLTDVRVREYPCVDRHHYFESMVTRDAGGVRLNAFGRAFLRFRDVPAYFGEARARR
ncbi:methyltransferase domain-containing protein [Geodermatophilus sp. SYSU D00815]